MKKILTFVLSALFALSLSAQPQHPGGPKGDKPGKDQKKPSFEEVVKMQAQDIAEQLALDNKTTKKFTEVYTAYKTDLNNVKKQCPVKHKAKGGEPLTDEQVEANIKARFAQSRAIIDVREKYYDEFRKILSPQQIEKIYMQDNKDHARMKGEQERREKRE